jgi:hypothetical protein
MGVHPMKWQLWIFNNKQIHTNLFRIHNRLGGCNITILVATENGRTDGWVGGTSSRL